MQHIILDKATHEIIHVNPSRQELSATEAYAAYDSKKHIHVRGPKPLPESWTIDGDVIREKTLQEKVDDGIIEKAGDEIVDGDKIRKMTLDEKLENSVITQSEYDEVKWTEIRAKRDGLLRGSDWTQVEDATVDKQAWKNYRKSLRDIPQNYTDWKKVQWPIAPK